MKRVEFSNTPPQYEILPLLNGQVVIRFYVDVQEDVREDGTAYIATSYELKTNRSPKLESRIEKNYDAWLEKAKNADGGLDAIKAEKIAASKVQLAEYLATHPLTSTAHAGKAGQYSVTEDKQSLMVSQYISYQAEKAMNPDAVLTWNETGKSCEVWTEAEFMQLVVEIKQYVAPLVSHQQTIEEQISACESLANLEAIVIDYENL